MRKEFASFLHGEMSYNEKIVLLTGDLGYGLWDQIRIDYPDRFYNVMSSEQLIGNLEVESDVFSLTGFGSKIFEFFS